MCRCRLLLPLVLVAALAAAACGDPPDKEIQQAQGAIDAAKAVGADEYAHDEFAAAQNALKNANDAVAQRDYRLALNHALDARDRAQTAATEAADRKAKARLDADHALTAATAALENTRARLKAAEANRVAPRTLAEARRSLASAEHGVQKARTDAETGAYLAAIDDANTATARLQALARAIESAATAPPRRRH
jgi:hypothetical protein